MSTRLKTTPEEKAEKAMLIKSLIDSAGYTKYLKPMFQSKLDDMARSILEGDMTPEKREATRQARIILKGIMAQPEDSYKTLKNALARVSGTED